MPEKRIIISQNPIVLAFPTDQDNEPASKRKKISSANNPAGIFFFSQELEATQQTETNSQAYNLTPEIAISTKDAVLSTYRLKPRNLPKVEQFEFDSNLDYELQGAIDIVEFFQENNEDITCSDITNYLDLTNEQMSKLIKKFLFNQQTIIKFKELKEYLLSMKNTNQLEAFKNSLTEKLDNELAWKEKCFTKLLEYGFSENQLTSLWSKLKVGKEKTFQTVALLYPNLFASLEKYLDKKNDLFIKNQIFKIINQQKDGLNNLICFQNYFEKFITIGFSAEQLLKLAQNRNGARIIPDLDSNHDKFIQLGLDINHIYHMADHINAKQNINVILTYSIELQKKFNLTIPTQIDILKYQYGYKALELLYEKSSIIKNFKLQPELLISLLKPTTESEASGEDKLRFLLSYYPTIQNYIMSIDEIKDKRKLVDHLLNKNIKSSFTEDNIALNPRSRQYFTTLFVNNILRNHSSTAFDFFNCVDKHVIDLSNLDAISQEYNLL